MPRIPDTLRNAAVLCSDCGRYVCGGPVPAYVTKRCPSCTAQAITNFLHVNRNPQTEEPDQVLPAETGETGTDETESP